jgi:hypothetical protein
VTAYTAGTASGVFFILQESTGGTNWTDIWVSDFLTSPSGIYRVPPIVVGGRRRWCCHSAGTSTTVTATITSLELPPGSYPLLREFRDRAVGSSIIQTFYNNAAITSTFASVSALNDATAPAFIEGCKLITALFYVSGTFTPSTNGVVTLEVSMAPSFAGAQAIGTATVSAAGTFSITAQNIAYKFARLRVSTALVISSGGASTQGAFIYATN